MTQEFKTLKFQMEESDYAEYFAALTACKDTYLHQQRFMTTVMLCVAAVAVGTMAFGFGRAGNTPYAVTMGALAALLVAGVFMVYTTYAKKQFMQAKKNGRINPKSYAVVHKVFVQDGRYFHQIGDGEPGSQQLDRLNAVHLCPTGGLVLVFGQAGQEYLPAKLFAGQGAGPVRETLLALAQQAKQDRARRAEQAPKRMELAGAKYSLNFQIERGDIVPMLCQANAQIAHSPAYWKNMRGTILMGVVLVAASFAFKAWQLGAAMLVIVVCAVGAGVFPPYVRLSYARRLAKGQLDMLVGAQVLGVYENGLRILRHSGDNMQNYAMYMDVREARDLWVLVQQRGKGVLPVPKTAFDSPEQEREVIDYLRQKIAAAQGQKQG